jgi:hypothetical protein
VGYRLTGRLQAIATKAAKRAPMVPVDRAIVSIATGVEGDFRGRHKARKATVLFARDWVAAASWTDRRSALLVAGMRDPQPVGDETAVG